AEKELQIKESAIAASINAIAIADLHGNLTYVNQSILSLWAHENEKDVLGKPMINFWQSKDEALTFMENLQKTGKWLGEMRARNKDGKTFVAQVSSGMVYARDGQPLCIMASFLDITEKHKYEKQLSQTQRLEAIGTLSGGIAHDFNNIQVVTYTNSEDALEAFRSGPEKFDLVITDMAMPKMSGDKLAVELITIRPDIPVLLCTGFSKAMTDEKIHAMGIKGFLMKPIVTNDLAQKIRELLDKK
ncbi:response regulator, partial [Desulfobacter sp.]|uniref:response regulator n=1 Tax=Desulfobacter sp. TaxID=2294 RepID=UPI003D141B38